MMEVENSLPKGGTKGKKGASSKTSSSSSAPLSERTNSGDNDERTIEQIYQKKTQLEHILLRPDTYIGSIETVTQPMWVLNPDTQRIVQQNICYVPGLYKIFDEIIVNASDNKQRDPTMDTIKVTIDQESNTLSVMNNGSGIPVVIHKEHKIYVPELIFGNLLTGSNFDDKQKKTTGGRNGYGAKLANIFSTKFTIETADSRTGKKYKQTFRDNMTVREDPVVTSMGAKDTDYTCVTFQPDLPRFKMDRLTDALVGLLSKRAYDVAGCGSGFPGKALKVYLNGKRIAVNSFQDYLKLYDGLEPPVAFERVNEKWEVGVAVSDGQFQQVSFVNGICTVKGGQHVNHVADQVVQKLMAAVKKKNKGQEVKGHQIKNHLAVYVNSLIQNPAFDSQTKETLTTRASAFGSECSLSDKFLKAVEKSDVVDKVVSWAKFKQDEQLKRKGGSKRTKVLGVPKLDDANFAGTAKSRDCTLILTEGDSAKALAISGLSVVGRDYYGVFPLKGKPLNVREAAHQQIVKNEEIQNVVKIMGLRFGTTYSDTSSLRYGHLMIMTDQDHDGSHIKGLLINLFHHFWPSLLQIPGFLQEFITPIVKASKGSGRVETFYTIPEYEAWKAAHGDGRGWTIKYYKGLGTSTAAEAKEYFSDIHTHRLSFQWRDDSDGDLIDMAFAKKRVDDRKDWLRAFIKGTHVDYKVEAMTYDAFINRELILFSMADNQRSIPSVMDGLKPAQRKVLFSCFKRNLKKEIKVAQLAGYVSEHSAYHHGEASLNGTILNMAQNFVGSNNINFLYPSGQFGTRIMGGKDAASPRYVFTRLEDITRVLYNPHDDPLLKYLDEDGQSIEPEYYVPIIPTVLVNGGEGIGTGWSSSIPNFNPVDVIANLRRMLSGEEMEEMHPWYRGFTGTIEPKTGARDQGSYVISGTFRRVDDVTIEITELPIKRWTQDYKQFLESMTVGATDEKGAFVKEFKERHTDTSVFFVITLSDAAAPELLIDDAALAKRLKIDASLGTSNMHLFSPEGLIKKYESPLAVIGEFFPHRMSLYEKRRETLISQVERDWRKLDNKVRFILSVVEGRLVVNNRKRAELLQDLARDGYELFDYRSVDGATEMDPNGSELARGYDYLLSMKIWSLTLEKVQELRAELRGKEDELDALRRTTPADMWLRDLDQLEEALTAYNDANEFEPAWKIAQGIAKKNTRAKPKPKPKPKGKKVVSVDSDDDDQASDMSQDDNDNESDEDSDFRPSPAKKAPGPRPKALPAPVAEASKPAAAPKNAKKPAKQPTAPKAKAPAAAKPKAKKVVSVDSDDDDNDEVFDVSEDDDDDVDSDEDSDFRPSPAKKAPGPRPKAVAPALAEAPKPAAARRNASNPAKQQAAPKAKAAAAASKAKTGAGGAGAKGGKAKKPDDNAENDEDDHDDVVVVSLAERMAARMQVGSGNGKGGDEDDDDSTSEVEEKDDQVMDLMSPPPKAQARKRAAKKGDDAGASSAARLFSPDKGVSPAVVKKARVAGAGGGGRAKTAPAAKTKAAKPAAAKKPTAAAAAGGGGATKKTTVAGKKKRKNADSDSDEDDDADFSGDGSDGGSSSPLVVAPRAAAPRRTAASKPVTYAVDVDDDESEEEEDEESDSGGEEDDDESDFSG